MRASLLNHTSLDIVENNKHSSSRRGEGGFEKEGISGLGGSFTHNVFVGLPTKERGKGVERGSEGELIVEEAIFRGFEQEGRERLLGFGHG